MMASRDNTSQQTDNSPKLVSTKFSIKSQRGRKRDRQLVQPIIPPAVSPQSAQDAHLGPAHVIREGLNLKKTTQTIAKKIPTSPNQVQSASKPSPGELSKQDKSSKKNLSPSQSYSSRNALRNFVDKEPRFPIKMPVFSSHHLSDKHHVDYNRIRSDLENIQFQPLNYTAFVQVSRGMALCFLCRKFMGHTSPHEVAEHHAQNQLHIENYLKLENLLLRQDLEDSSLQMASVQELLDRWYEQNCPNNEDISIRVQMIQELSNIVKCLMPECELRTYGSLSTGTLLKSSNINLELVHPNSKLFESDPRSKNSSHHKLIYPDAELGEQINIHTLHYDLVSNPMDILYKLYKSIGNTYNQNYNFKLMSDLRHLSDKVPKLVIKHSPSNVLIHVSCYAESSYLLAKLLRKYLSLDSRLFKLCTIINYWAKNCRISNAEGGTFPPDAYIIMAIYYLQRTSPPVLPCLHEMIGKDGRLAHGRQKTTSNDLSNKMMSLNLQPDLLTDDQPNVRDFDLVDDDVEVQEDYNDDTLYEEEEYDENVFDENNDITWTSENKDPIHKLFLGFLKAMMVEFSDISNIISIRTLKEVSLHSKDWVTQFKAVENPVRPQVNISKCLGPRKTYHFIKSCFERSYYYLTSMPLDEKLNPKQYKPESDPKDLASDIYIATERMEFYFQMRRESIISKCKSYDPISEMIQQNLFAKDIGVLESIIQRATDASILQTLPRTISNFYNDDNLFKNDDGALYCRFCRLFGHERYTCPKANETEECLDYDPSSCDTLDSCVNLDDGLLALYHRDNISPRLAEHHISLVKQLESIINSNTDLNCELTLFGSTVNNLGSYDSDLDLCLTLAGNPTGKGVDYSDILHKVHFALLPFAQNMEMILSARVPIIKFKYNGFDIDISMYNQCAIYNSRLLKTYADIDPRVSQLFYLVKKYAKCVKIGDASRGSLSSYAWSLMTIHYLQHTRPKVLPVLQETGQDRMFGVLGWNVWFDDEPVWEPEVKNEWSLTRLYKGFFQYYAKFDFDTYIVSIRKNALITRFQKSWYNSPIAIEDPFELTYNLAARLEEPMTVFIKNSFSRVLEHIINFQEGLIRQTGNPNVGKLKIMPKVIAQLFSGRGMIKANAPKSSRGCKICERIGHKAANCPSRRESLADRKRNTRRKDMKP